MAIAFAGPLSRFFAADAAEAARLRAGVELWRDHLRASVADKLGEQLVWDEGADVAATADLGEAGWLALRLFAFYAERTELELPDTVPALLELDREWRAAHDGKFATSKYGHLLACRAWLPGDFPVTLRAPMPDGAAAEIGSLAVLHDQLRWLNDRTFAAEAETIAGWRDLPAPTGGELLAAARRGYGALHAVCAAARAAKLPLVVREA
ncbi:MAG: hypothetical protein JNM25_08930 [Planctomycetes bacterium]|nr:hypothetical protein [Planctomycetota bacterium]